MMLDNAKIEAVYLSCDTSDVVDCGTDSVTLQYIGLYFFDICVVTLHIIAARVSPVS